jgi:DNA-binding beta-propeller fold protein YncE
VAGAVFAACVAVCAGAPPRAALAAPGNADPASPASPSPADAPRDAAQPLTGPAAPSLATTAPTSGESIPIPDPLPDCCKPIAIDVPAPPVRQGASFLRVIGHKGTKPGELAYPRALAAAPDGTIYVVDKQGRIQMLDADLRFKALVRTPQIDNGKPTGLAIAANGDLIVADTHYARVLVYSRDLTLKSAFGRPGSAPGCFLFLADARYLADGRLLTLDYADDVARVQVFDKAGKISASWGKFGAGAVEFQRPMALAADEGRGELYVADAVNHRVQVLDLKTGGFKRAFGGLGDERGRLKYPYDISIDEQGRAWVVEFGNHRLQVFDREGRSIGAWGKPGRAEGEIAFPWAVALEPNGRVLLLDSGNDRIYELDRSAVLDAPEKKN